MTLGAGRRQGPFHAKVRVALWALATVAAVNIAGAALADQELGAVAVQAVLAEWGAGRMLVTWSDPTGTAPTTGAMARRALAGVGVGFGAAAALGAVALAVGAAFVVPGPRSLMALPVGLFLAAFAAARDELLLRGAILRLLRGMAPPAVALLVCGLSSVAFGLGSPAAGSSPAELACLGLGGVAFGSLWLRDRGAWLPWGAHTAWSFALHTALRGGVLDLRTRAGPGPLLGSPVAIGVTLALAVAAVAASPFPFWRRRAWSVESWDHGA